MKEITLGYTGGDLYFSVPLGVSQPTWLTEFLSRTEHKPETCYIGTSGLHGGEYRTYSIDGVLQIDVTDGLVTNLNPVARVFFFHGRDSTLKEAQRLLFEAVTP